MLPQIDYLTVHTPLTPETENLIDAEAVELLKPGARLINAARGGNENTMEERLAGERVDAVNGRGTAVKKREDTHKMADANKAFSHYRW